MNERKKERKRERARESERERGTGVHARAYTHACNHRRHVSSCACVCVCVCGRGMGQGARTWLHRVRWRRHGEVPVRLECTTRWLAGHALADPRAPPGTQHTQAQRVNNATLVLRDTCSPSMVPHARHGANSHGCDSTDRTGHPRPPTRGPPHTHTCLLGFRESIVQPLLVPLCVTSSTRSATSTCVCGDGASRRSGSGSPSTSTVPAASHWVGRVRIGRRLRVRLAVVVRSRWNVARWIHAATVPLARHSNGSRRPRGQPNKRNAHVRGRKIEKKNKQRSPHTNQANVVHKSPKGEALPDQNQRNGTSMTRSRRGGAGREPTPCGGQQRAAHNKELPRRRPSFNQGAGQAASINILDFMNYANQRKTM